MKSYDLVILGAGPGGYVSAIYASRLGLTTCLIEKDLLGGTCLNRGCIPTKVLLNAAKTLSSLKDASAYGIDILQHRFSPDRLFLRKDEIVSRLRRGISSLLSANKVDVVTGHGRIKARGVVEVNCEELRVRNIIIATGSSPQELTAMKFDGVRVLSSDGILNLTRIPKSILVVGGGVIGVEFSQFYNACGSSVSVVELMDRLLPLQEREIGRKLESLLRKRGVRVETSKGVERMETGGEGIVAHLSDGTELQAEVALVCAGRRTCTSGIGLEEAGVRLERGRVAVDEYLETSVKGIYSIGDVIGEPMLAHAASYEGIVACDNIAGKRRKVDFASIPHCIYTDPEIATCGMSEDEAKKGGADVKVAKFPYSASGKANVIGKGDGFVKIVGDGSGRVLGVEIFGEGACDLIGEASLAIANRMTVEAMARAVHGHPTISEVMGEASRLFLGTPIHCL